MAVSGVVTFGELDSRMRRLARLLEGGGLRSGDRIAVYSRNRAEVIEVVAAALRAGIVPVPINPLLTRPEVDYILDDSGARWLFTDTSMDLRPSLDQAITFGDAYERALQGAGEAEIADHILTRPMYYTSGTTGAPKGVYVPVADPDAAAAAAERFRALWSLGSEDIHLVCSPLAHSAPLRFALRTLESGGSVVTQERFDAESTLAAIELFAVTSTFMVPTHLDRVLGLGRGGIARFDLSSIGLLAHAGAPIHGSVKREVVEIFPRGSVWEFYGSTEGQATRISTEEWLRKPGSVGQAYPGTKVYVMSADFTKMPVGETGTVWVLDETAEPFSYWGDPEKTESAWRDGAFTVGDLGYLDEDGYLFLVGRADDTIITGGVNVYPAEVESVLIQHPTITEVIVFGAPSEEWGQEVRARVVPATGEVLDTDDLNAWARERLASFKVPKEFEVVETIPKTATGKRKRPGR